MALKPGIYTARIADYGITKTKDGLPQVKITFAIDGDQITWYGSFKERAQKYTLDSLLVCGLVGDDVSTLAIGPASAALDMSKDISLVLAEQEYDGKTNLRVRWINEPGGQAAQTMNSGEAAQIFEGLNLKAALLERRQATGKKSEPKKVDLSDLPF